MFNINDHEGTICIHKYLQYFRIFFLNGPIKPGKVGEILPLRYRLKLTCSLLKDVITHAFLVNNLCFFLVKFIDKA